MCFKKSSSQITFIGTGTISEILTNLLGIFLRKIYNLFYEYRITTELERQYDVVYIISLQLADNFGICSFSSEQ